MKKKKTVDRKNVRKDKKVDKTIAKQDDTIAPLPGEAHSVGKTHPTTKGEKYFRNSTGIEDLPDEKGIIIMAEHTFSFSLI